MSAAAGPAPSSSSASAVTRTARFDEIRYAQVWEDPRVLRRALQVNAGDTVFSIAAAGDNALALLLDDPARVVAVDFSPAQLALCRLKALSLRTLSHAELLSFVGVTPSATRLHTWTRLRPLLDDDTRAFFDARPAAVAQGILHAGKFERYFRLFRTRVLPLVHNRETVQALLAAPSVAAQERVFHERFDTWRWRLLFRVFFGEALLGRLGRDPAFFRHVQIDDVGAHFLARARACLLGTPLSDHYFAEYILTGGYGGAHTLPPWLEAANVDVLRARLDRIEWVQGDALQVASSLPAHSVNAFNLSDIFEWMDEAQTEEAYRALLLAAAPGARLCSWNLLVPRQAPASLRTRVVRDDALSTSLHAIDRGFFYRALHVERVADNAA